jgi:hypothetical protein
MFSFIHFVLECGIVICTVNIDGWLTIRVFCILLLTANMFGVGASPFFALCRSNVRDAA